MLFSRLVGFLPGTESLALPLSKYEWGRGGSLALSESVIGLIWSGGAVGSAGSGGPGAGPGGLKDLVVTGSLDWPGDEDEDGSVKADIIVVLFIRF